MGSAIGPTATIIPVPPWLWGNNPVGLFQYAELRAKVIPGQPNIWRAQTEEAYLCRRPDLVSVEHLAGPSSYRLRIDMLRDLAIRETVNSAYERGSREVQRRGARAEKTGEMVDLFSAWQLQTMIAYPDELESVVAQVHAAMGKSHLLKTLTSWCSRTVACMLFVVHSRSSIEQNLSRCSFGWPMMSGFSRGIARIFRKQLSPKNPSSQVRRGSGRVSFFLTPI